MIENTRRVTAHGDDSAQRDCDPSIGLMVNEKRGIEVTRYGAEVECELHGAC